MLRYQISYTLYFLHVMPSRYHQSYDYMTLLACREVMNPWHTCNSLLLIFWRCFLFLNETILAILFSRLNRKYCSHDLTPDQFISLSNCIFSQSVWHSFFCWRITYKKHIIPYNIPDLNCVNSEVSLVLLRRT